MSTTSQAYELNNPPVIAELLEGEIVASWSEGQTEFAKIRAPYLFY